MLRFVFQEAPDFSSQCVPINVLESKPLKGLRVGLIRETLDDGVDKSVSSVINVAASHLEGLGCFVSKVHLIFL